MKVNTFAAKYCLPTTIVYQASFNTPTRMRDKKADIPESELYDAVKESLQGKIRYHKGLMEENEARLQYLLHKYNG